MVKARTFTGVGGGKPSLDLENYNRERVLFWCPGNPHRANQKINVFDALPFSVPPLRGSFSDEKIFKNMYTSFFSNHSNSAISEILICCRQTKNYTCGLTKECFSTSERKIKFLYGSQKNDLKKKFVEKKSLKG